MMNLRKATLLQQSANGVIRSPHYFRPNKQRAVQTMVQSTDQTNSFISQFKLEGSRQGPLAGLTLAVKDLYDVAGHKTGFGSPTWLDTHPVAQHTAPVVTALLDAGAMVVGKTHMDEMAYSLMGQNAHYGTPVNVAAPGRIPGGSSSGSAAAVAAQQADIGLGSDTGGSVRVPASFCGLFGIRPTHGRISLEHARPLAPSYDTCGWFARDADLLQRVGHVLFQHHSSQHHPTTQQQSNFNPRWLVAKDAFAVVQPATAQAIYNALSGSTFEGVKAVLGQPSEVNVAEGNETLEGDGLQSLAAWADVFRITQAYEIWQTHGAWVTQAKPRFGPGIADRFKMAASITEAEFHAADAKRSLIKQHMYELLGADGLLALPTAPGPAVLCETADSELNEWRKGLLSLTCIAGLSGLPQVTLPIATVDGLPVGFSLIGPANSDERLLDVAVQLTAVLQKS